MNRYGHGTGREERILRVCESMETQDGFLRVDVVNSENNFPIKDAEVSIQYPEEE